MNKFLQSSLDMLRDRDYLVGREPWHVRARFWAMRRPVRMYLFIVAAFALGAWLL